MKILSLHRILNILPNRTYRVKLIINKKVKRYTGDKLKVIKNHPLV